MFKQCEYMAYLIDVNVLKEKQIKHYVLYYFYIVILFVSDQHFTLEKVSKLFIFLVDAVFEITFVCKVFITPQKSLSKHYTCADHLTTLVDHLNKINTKQRCRFYI